MKVFKNGRVHTMDKGRPLASAFVVNQGKFVFAGTDEEAEAFAAENGGAQQVVDLEDRLVIPGLNDSHMHFLHYAISLLCVDLTGTKSIGEIKERMKKAIKPGSTEWLIGEGWNQDYFEDEVRFPNRFDLDEVSKDVPILIKRACFHVGVLNSAALALLGMDKESIKPYGDYVGTLENGEPDGLIKENVLDELKEKLSDLSKEQMKELIVAAQDKVFADGLTSVQSDDIGYTPGGDYDLFFGVLRELDQEGKLKLRIAEQTLIQKTDTIQKFFDSGYRYGGDNHRYRVGCIKLLADGSLGARTAAMRQPYADDPSTEGLLIFTQEELNELVLTAQKNGCPAAIHAIGDRTVEQCLNAIEYARKADPAGKLRHGIVHCQITDKELLSRFKELDALALIQPIFLDYDSHIVEARVGKELASTSYGWKTMIDLGVHASFGTDCPVESFATMPNIYAAVTRKNITGKEKAVFCPEECVSMEEAIYAYTVEGAYASAEEEVKGAIAAGMLADFIVLDQDLFSLTDQEEILNTRVLRTYVDGQLVYEAK